MGRHRVCRSASMTRMSLVNPRNISISNFIPYRFNSYRCDILLYFFLADILIYFQRGVSKQECGATYSFVNCRCSNSIYPIKETRMEISLSDGEHMTSLFVHRRPRNASLVSCHDILHTFTPLPHIFPSSSSDSFNISRGCALHGTATYHALSGTY